MVQVNFARKEVNCKLVYYGPGMSGKTTNLEVVHEKIPKKNKGDLIAIATEGDRTLFFDFLPIDLGKVMGMSTKFQLYTVPGQVYYASTRKLVLQGADGVIFIADSQEDKLEENIEALKDLEDNLKESGIDLKDFPFVIQWNKRDLPNAADVKWLDEKINRFDAPTTEAIASSGEGVMGTLKIVAKMVLDKLNEKKSTVSRHTSPVAASKKDEAIVATINGNRMKYGYFSNYCQTQYRLGSTGDVEDFKKFSKKETLAMLDGLVNYTLLMHEAKNNKVSVNRKKLETQVAQFRKKHKTDEAFEKYLKSHHLKRDNIKNEAIRSIVVSTMLKIKNPDLNEKLEVSSDEITDYYKSHESAFPDAEEKYAKRISRILKNKKKKKLLDALYGELRSKSKIEIFKDRL